MRVISAAPPLRKMLIWSARVLGALLLAAFLFAGTVAGRIYWLAVSGLPDHRLAEGASSWHGCIPPEAKRAEFLPLNAMPASAINAFLAAAEPNFLTREAHSLLTDARQVWRRKPLGGSPISEEYVRQLLFCVNNNKPDGDPAHWHYKAGWLHSTTASNAICRGAVSWKPC